MWTSDLEIAKLRGFHDARSYPECRGYALSELVEKAFRAFALSKAAKGDECADTRAEYVAGFIDFWRWVSSHSFNELDLEISQAFAHNRN